MKKIVTLLILFICCFGMWAKPTLVKSEFVIESTSKSFSESVKDIDLDKLDYRECTFDEYAEAMPRFNENRNYPMLMKGDGAIWEGRYTSKWIIVKVMWIKDKE